MRTILVIDSDRATQSAIRTHLALEGFNIRAAMTGSDGLKLAMTCDPSVVVLDLGLPDSSGLDLCRTIRSRLEVPIMLMSASGDESVTVRGLGCGADDFLTKPFGMGEMTARVKAILRRYEYILDTKRTRQPERSGSPSLLCGPFCVDFETHTVTQNSNTLTLTSKEFDLLLFFLQNPGKVFTKDVLYEKVWGSAYDGDTRTVLVHISRLRKKIEKRPEKPEIILNVWGVGYKMRG
jgi:DNA-binding response OmpR family regulator